MEIISQVSREAAICSAFTSLTDSVAEDSSPVMVMEALADECIRLLPVDSAEFFLPGLHLERYPSAAEDGPALEAFETGQGVTVTHLPLVAPRWPGYVERTVALGYISVSAFPMRSQGEIVGAMTLLSTESAELSDKDRLFGQALTDVATHCLAQQGELRHYKVLSTQLQTALDSRIIIEQAKGVLAERGGLSVSTAFERMRSFARGTNRKLADVAHGVVDGTLHTDGFIRSRRR